MWQKGVCKCDQIDGDLEMGRLYLITWVVIVITMLLIKGGQRSRFREGDVPRDKGCRGWSTDTKQSMLVAHKTDQCKRASKMSVA